MERRLDLLKKGSRYLETFGLINPRGEAEILLAHILNCPRSALYLDNLPIRQGELKDFSWFLKARAQGRPLQYLVGSWEFMGLEFKTAPEVFIPRPETEILVQTAIEILTSRVWQRRQNQQKILDIATGCGNIAISMAKYLNKAHIFACDISDFALQLSKENSRLNRVNIVLVKSDLLSAFKQGSHFTLLISNPPYVQSGRLCQLPRELHYEPRIALDGGSDGLSFYQRIISQAADYLQIQGLLMLEIGDEQALAVKKLFAQQKAFSLVKVVEDYNGKERVVVAQRKT